MNYYVEIPNNSLESIRFPATCPFTLEPNPGRQWEVVGRTKSSAVIVPLVPVMCVSGRKCVFQIPASNKFVRGQYALTLFCFGAFLLFFVVLLTNEFAKFPNKIIEPIVFIVIAVGTFAYCLRQILRRHVWIDYVGSDLIEIVFKRKVYADEFCTMNGLEQRRKLVNFRSR
jgi:hypothetical protein